MEREETRTLAEIIRRRRTRKPAQFSKEVPPKELMRELIEIARHAPNHHRTEPARFYLLNQETIREVGKLFGEVVRGDGKTPALIEKGNRKTSEWGNAPGLLIVTCSTDLESELIRKNPAVVDEDYATCSCICQNLLLLLEAEGIACKWSTGPVWEHANFANIIKMREPENERVVGLLFYGYSTQDLSSRPLTPIDEHLVEKF
ncbi:MAG: nitroreductase [Verrucomicrobiota bacterium]|nr:nitroreductase [Verrucomicrobiota bacterium]